MCYLIVFLLCVCTYCGNLQVVADVHSVHIFLRDGVRAVQISQKAGRLEGAQTKTQIIREALRQQSLLVIHLCRCLTSILFSRFIATGFSAVHRPTRCRLSCLNKKKKERNAEVLQLFQFCKAATTIIR